MGEKTGLLTTLIIIAVFVLPLFQNNFSNNAKGTKVLNTATQLQQMVSAEGGVTPRVENTISELTSHGYNIEITSEEGEAVGVLPVGTKVDIMVNLDGFETHSFVTVNKRVSMEVDYKMRNVA